MDIKEIKYRNLLRLAKDHNADEDDVVVTNFEVYKCKK